MERLTYNFPAYGQNCWQVKGADNALCKDVCEDQGDNGCKNCPIAKAFDRLAAYEDTGLEPEQVKAFVSTADNIINLDIKELVERLHKRIALTTAGSPLQNDLLEAADAIEELLPSADVEPLTYNEQSIFLAAMRREEKVCKRVNEEYEGSEGPYEVDLVRICHEITRKVKGALWTI